ncbi:hypothetical protein [Blautia sp. MSJ-19]|uniref:hypothetical protein n=1 Tax=Blautia sp. MSJ-19 TaxID=2841517 RepID=UPI001C0F34FA|nr:hypothetical protein [Blautia sp. MSJ-19]MBU5481400.1 hypothetical protein [Blautia sp. MSJ-19]
MENRRNFSRLIMQAFAILLCFTLLSMWLLSNMYARYTTQASGEDSARVAKFNVTETGKLTQDIEDISIAPGGSTEYEVSVTNNSEVAISYSISAVNKYKNLPLEFQMYKKTDSDSDTKILVVEDQISATDRSEHTYTLKISWNTEDAGQRSENYAGKTDAFVITLKAVQID